MRLYRRFSAGGQGGDLFILLRQDALEFLAGDVFLFQQVFGQVVQLGGVLLQDGQRGIIGFLDQAPT